MTKERVEMFCPNCGKPLADDAAFCEQCGIQIEPEQESDAFHSSHPAQTPMTVGPSKNSETMEHLSQFVKGNRKIIGVVAAFAVFIAVVVIYIAVQPPTVKLNDYVRVEFSGYDTVGTATYQFDEEAFCRDYAGKIDFKGEGLTALIEGLEDEDICKKLLDECVSGRLSRNTGLSNGDTVNVRWECDDDTAEADFGVRLSYEDLAFTVEGLQEAQEIDPFAEIELTYSGTAPNGEVSLANHAEDSLLSNLRYEVEPTNGLDNGDTVTVSLPNVDTGESRRYYLTNFGVVFTETQKTYTVEGLGAYVTSLSEVAADTETLDEMKARGEDSLRATAAKEWSEEISLDSMTYLGSYLLMAKDTDGRMNPNNMLYLVYQVQSSANLPEDGIHQSFSYYYTVQFNNLTVSPDGKISVNLGEYSTSRDRFRKEFGNRSYYYNGYENLDTAFRQSVSVNVDRYTYESNIETGQTAAA